MQADELNCRARLRAMALAMIRDLEELGYERPALVGLSIIELDELRQRAVARLMAAPSST